MLIVLLNKNKKTGTTTMTEKESHKIEVRIASDEQLSETLEASNERKAKIGTNIISNDRRANITDTYNDDGSANEEGWDAYNNELFVKKDSLDDHDLQEVAASFIDLQILDLVESSTDNEPITDSYDILSRTKSIIQFIDFSETKPLQPALMEVRDRFVEEGDDDMSEVADLAIDILYDISSEALDMQGTGDGSNAEVETYRVISEHNQRVDSNKQRADALEQQQAA